MSFKTKPITIVVVGAGFGGLSVYNNLLKHLASYPAVSDIELVLIAPRGHFVHYPASLRLIGQPSEDLDAFLEFTMMPLDPRFEPKTTGIVKHRSIQARVESITDNSTTGERFVLLDNGQRVYYTYLALAPGSSWEGPIAFPDTLEETKVHVKNWREKFTKAQNIVLIGGGANSFELAGELKDEWPDKPVTIIHNRLMMLNDTYPESWRKYVGRNIAKRGVSLVLNDRLEDLDPKEGFVTTAAGKRIPADLVIRMVGPRLNTSFLSSLRPKVLTETGHIQVRPTLQLHDYPHIFAAGDVVASKETPSAVKAVTHGEVVTNNISTLLKAKSEDAGVPALKNYTGQPEALILTNGKKHGTMYLGLLWGLSFGDWVTSWLTRNTVFASRAKNLYGL